jgi:hypothetical protein
VVGASGNIVMASRTVFANAFVLTIDGDECGCPTVCDDCSRCYVLTVSGLTGACEALCGGTHYLIKSVTNPCRWVTATTGAWSLQCMSGTIWEARWFTSGLYPTLYGTANSVDDRPPSAFTVGPGGPTGVCVGQVGTVLVSPATCPADRVNSCDAVCNDSMITHTVDITPLAPYICAICDGCAPPAPIMTLTRGGSCASGSVNWFGTGGCIGGKSIAASLNWASSVACYDLAISCWSGGGSSANLMFRGRKGGVSPAGTYVCVVNGHGVQSCGCVVPTAVSVVVT